MPVIILKNTSRPPELIKHIRLAKIKYRGIRSVHNGFAIIPATQDDHKALVKLLKANLVSKPSGFNTQKSADIKPINVAIRGIHQDFKIQHVKDDL